MTSHCASATGHRPPQVHSRELFVCTRTYTFSHHITSCEQPTLALRLFTKPSGTLSEPDPSTKNTKTVLRNRQKESPVHSTVHTYTCGPRGPHLFSLFGHWQASPPPKHLGLASTLGLGTHPRPRRPGSAPRTSGTGPPPSNAPQQDVALSWDATRPQDATILGPRDPPRGTGPRGSLCPPSRATASTSELVGSWPSSVPPRPPTPVGTSRLRTMEAPMPPWPLSTSRLRRSDVGLRVMSAAVSIRAAREIAAREIAAREIAARESSQLLLLLSSAAPHRRRSGVC